MLIRVKVFPDQGLREEGRLTEPTNISWSATTMIAYFFWDNITVLNLFWSVILMTGGEKHCWKATRKIGFGQREITWVGYEQREGGIT